MLALTKRTEYALIALCHLARQPDEIVSARDLARHYGVRLPLLMNVLKALNQKGLVRSTRGANGGYRLSVLPANLSLGRVAAAIEGPTRLVKCVTAATGDESECELIGSCPVRRPVLRVHEQLERFLAGVSIADLAFDEGYGQLDPLQAKRRGTVLLPTLTAEQRTSSSG
jgi:Rrf2 family protein